MTRRVDRYLGTPVHVVDSRQHRPNRPASWQAGNSVEYTVRRNGRELALAVPLVRLFPQLIWNYASRQLAGSGLSSSRCRVSQAWASSACAASAWVCPCRPWSW